VTSDARVEVLPDRDLRITFRMSPREYKAMLDFMARHRMTNVSAFIRMAIDWAVTGGMA
jgi:hypothetical protein